ncbi:hypothetical protein [Roseibacillus ishigakijimensis]|uniref:Uncharacterized protein n=1 Tax=Roseibacillus ishigakijimensis TaxID=454146 RepID=A0A934VIZ0_9BACT|nr:hypothetical protein [Roseibacillus ishigakijimensis]MBK1835593.1 hypothetical protein [Roseibacillus ishigakijimensis]
MKSENLLEELEKAHGAPPENLSPALQVLWLAKAGDWEGAHNIAQDMPDPQGAWLHAHLHRQEGDLGNASYWYHRANQPVPSREISIEAEWLDLAAHFTRHSR